MKVVYIVGITFLVLLMFIYQWPRIQSGERREKAAFAALTVMGWGIATMYIMFPTMTSPAKIIDFLLVQLRNIVTSPF
ncbi:MULTISPECIES: hypothetical protein [Paenibacillus]|uniref:Uncharacterized protein n=1 Tax=Paenibacillus campinasensis TaxID=66347 RepID=A0A268F0F7_9BACL|nr:hypothetical protein [Paenibacillus campinasensis]MUG65608.1 hypothetical protein [Paenibacillus campinasensis]PAD78867.1 hypothetical protein CHH67_05280 [Paenibacillus campinasensis]